MRRQDCHFQMSSPVKTWPCEDSQIPLSVLEPQIVNLLLWTRIVDQDGVVRHNVSKDISSKDVPIDSAAIMSRVDFGDARSVFLIAQIRSEVSTASIRVCWCIKFAARLAQWRNLHLQLKASYPPWEVLN
jgi:hypothetical protein